jgi:hypothetical protein
VSELLLTGGILALVVGATSLFALVPWHVLFGLGISLIALGLAVGVPTGFWYHVLLRREMLARGPAVKLWWLRPQVVYDALDEPEKRRVRPWLYVGGAGFLLAMLGCLFFGVGTFRS